MAFNVFKTAPTGTCSLGFMNVHHMCLLLFLASVPGGLGTCGRNFSGPTYITAVVNQKSIIMSPNYPGNYSVETKCEWSIEAQLGQVIRLSIVDIDLEPTSSCTREDFVEILDGRQSNSSRLQLFCTADVPVIYSSGPGMYIRFTSDLRVTGRGFNFTAQALNISYIPEYAWPAKCSPSGRTIDLNAVTFEERYIVSPNHPSQYSNNSQCAWRLRALTNLKVRLTLIFVDIETRDNCLYDRLDVHDGYSASAKLQFRVCTRRCPVMYSNGEWMYLKFQSDASNTGKGFRVGYKAVNASIANANREPGECGNSGRRIELRALSDKKLSFTSTNYPDNYPNNAVQDWRITANAGSIILLKVTSLDIETSPNCVYDSVIVYDGYSSSSTQLRIFCTLQYPEIYSSGRYLFVRFVADISETRKGFLLTYQEVNASEAINETQSCNFPWNSIPEYKATPFVMKYIMLPNYTANTHLHGECKWQIKAGREYMIRFGILKLQSGSAHNCFSTNVKVYNGHSAYYDKLPPSIINGFVATESQGRELYIVFTIGNLSCNGVVFFYEAFNSDGITKTSAFVNTSMMSTTLSYKQDSIANLSSILGSCFSMLFVILVYIIIAYIFMSKKSRHVSRTATTAAPPQPTAAHDHRSLDLDIDPTTSDDSRDIAIILSPPRHERRGHSSLAFVPEGREPPPYYPFECEYVPSESETGQDSQEELPPHYAAAMLDLNKTSTY